MRFPDEASLEDVMSIPTEALREALASWQGNVVVLGAAGKMGPTLCLRLRRALPDHVNLVAVSRFSDPASRAWFHGHGIDTLPVDLMDPNAPEGLPDADRVVYLVGMKFGTTDNPALTWAVNALLPDRIVRRYAGCKGIVALSTGNVYPLVSVESGGSVESDPLTPIGEYANACVARERIFQYASVDTQTPLALIRLNYAIDLRYGLLIDIGSKVLRGEPVDCTMGYLNGIWQGDANEAVLRAFSAVSIPANPLNLTGTERWSVRDLATRLAQALGVSAQCVGQEAPNALLSNVAKGAAVWGEHPTSQSDMIAWTAAWLLRGGRTLGKPTKFEVRDGQY